MPQTLFTTQEPAFKDNADGVDAYSMGTYFRSSVPGRITHIRWYFPLTAQPGGLAVKANLFRNSDSLKLGGADALFSVPGTPGAWNQVALTTPVDIVDGTDYCATIWTPLRYVATNGGAAPWPFSNGVLSALSSAGRFQSQHLSDSVVKFPSGSFNNGCYFVDVVFVPEGETEEPEGLTVSVWNGSVELPATMKVWNGSAEVAANVTEIST
jgi:hypothetical protein